MKLKKFLEMVAPGEYVHVFNFECDHICNIDVSEGLELSERYQAFINICYYDVIELDVFLIGAVKDCVYVILKEVS